MRKIDADRLKKVIDKNFYGTGGASVMMQLIDEQPTVDDWIPVTERLPEVGSVVLCYCKNRAWMVGRINVCKYCAADKYKDKPYFDYNMNGFPDVLAWKPLPEPYKGE